MSELYRVLILAVVQGVAEFLPISSSGHLIILGSMLGELGESATLEIILHAGTLGSIIVVFWRKIIDLIIQDRRVIGLLVIATLPAVVVGLTIKSEFPWLMRSPLLAGAMLIVTGGLLIVLGRLPKKDGSYLSMSWVGAFLVGCFQAVAILPGISRSGSTIVGGRLMGLKDEDSVTFSFLLAIPAICGATVLALKDLIEDGPESGGVSPSILLAGTLTAFVVGIFALRWLIRWSRADRLHWFAYWCIPIGIAVVSFEAYSLMNA